MMNILVPESATDQELTELLNQLLQDASQRTGFQYHDHPTVVGIYAYASREHAAAGMGQWEAMVAKTPPDPEPSVRIRSGRGTVAEPANRFGLTTQERMVAYRQKVGAEDRGQAEAEREFPTENAVDLADFTRQFERADQLAEQYKQDLADELGITRDQLDEIALEGLQQNWPMPALVPPLARPPARGADDIDERIINPCIAASAAQNDLGDIEPWELRNLYPEIYEPLEAQMRALAAPMLAEFGDDALARNILLDRFRDDCIRGARGETETVDWSEAEVRELLSISQEEATQYEIPLLNVNGEPYFPGERCDSPWVEHTPITAGEGWQLSDTGWLCESTTPPRFCQTLDGERGWEQGFFTCSSHPRFNTSDWLQEWKRSQ